MRRENVGNRRRLVALGLGALAVVALASFAAQRMDLVGALRTALSAGREQPAIIKFSRFSAHRERTEEGERLSISLRLRTELDQDLSCYAFVVARNDHVTPRIWSIWPSQAPGASITTGGHFHGAEPKAGHHVELTDRWQRITATVPHPEGGDRFDTVVVYVLSADGKVLLARPFSV
jgi:hypothetical protein